MGFKFLLPKRVTNQDGCDSLGNVVHDRIPCVRIRWIRKRFGVIGRGHGRQSIFCECGGSRSRCEEVPQAEEEPEEAPNGEEAPQEGRLTAIDWEPSRIAGSSRLSHR